LLLLVALAAPAFGVIVGLRPIFSGARCMGRRARTAR